MDERVGGWMADNRKEGRRMEVKSHVVPQHSDIHHDYKSDYFRGENYESYLFSAIGLEETYWQCE
jgi:hypothetical protein